MPHKLITINGRELLIRFTFKRGRKGSYLQPDDPDELELREVWLQGRNIIRLLTNKLETQILNKLEL